MSPKEEATAVRLLRRWVDAREQVRKSKELFDLTSLEDLKKRIGTALAAEAQYEAIDRETRAFIAHEDPNA